MVRPRRAHNDLLTQGERERRHCATREVIWDRDLTEPQPLRRTFQMADDGASHLRRPRPVRFVLGFEERAIHKQAARGAVRFQVVSRHDLLTQKERQRVVAACAAWRPACRWIR